MKNSTKKKPEHKVTVKAEDGSSISIKTCRDCAYFRTCNKRYENDKVRTVRCTEFK